MQFFNLVQRWALGTEVSDESERLNLIEGDGHAVDGERGFDGMCLDCGGKVVGEVWLESRELRSDDGEVGGERDESRERVCRLEDVSGGAKSKFCIWWLISVVCRCR